MSNDIQFAPKRRQYQGSPRKIDKYKHGQEYRRLKDLLLQHDLKNNTDAFRMEPKVLEAGILLFAGLEIGTNNMDKLYRYLGYNIPKYTIQDMASRLHKCGIWQEGTTYCDWMSEDGYVSLMLDAMVATGQLKCEFRYGDDCESNNT